jgi:ergothioneine biosynthesis protein EgtB
MPGSMRQELISKYLEVRDTSLAIASPLSAEDMQIQSMPDASPIKWHLAHTTWAFETFFLKPYVKEYKPFDPSFEFLFNSYYNAIGEQYSRANRGQLSRPTIETILDYRHRTDSQMLGWLNETEELSVSQLERLELMLNHEQQHQELMLTDIKHGLSLNPTYPRYHQSSSVSYAETPLSWLDFEGGLSLVGVEGDGFYFDNESPSHQVFIQPFKIASRLVTNAEYLNFIESGGYNTARYWLSEAWYRIKEQSIKKPLYWHKKEGEWFEFTHNGLIPLEPHAPVMHLDYFEANAYASFVDKRLPTEHEWELAAAHQSLDGCYYRHDTMYPQSAKGLTLEQMFGELWQWTSSSYNAYPGFKVKDGAIGEYNGKFMVNQYVLRGGSVASPKGHIRSTYRNFFYPNAAWQFTGIRLAESS